MPRIKVDGASEIHFVRTGPRGAPPIVLLHPVGLDLTWWGAQIAEFGRNYDVLAFDMPSHGLSGKLAQAPSFDIMAAAVEGLLDHVGAGAAHLVGVSVGGMIAQTVALRRPDLVASLCLVATLCAFPDQTRSALRERAPGLPRRRHGDDRAAVQ